MCLSSRLPIIMFEQDEAKCLWFLIFLRTSSFSEDEVSSLSATSRFLKAWIAALNVGKN